MERKYSTNHQGIAAYLVMKGYEIMRVIPGTNRKTGKPMTTFEFDIEYNAGREMGDAYYDGHAVGNLKDFADAQFKVRDAMRRAR